LLEQPNVLQRKDLVQRVVKKIADGDVDAGHVEQQEHHGSTDQRNSEVEPVETGASRRQHERS
jgi:TATA-binding protein-associated factor Taf7